MIRLAERTGRERWARIATWVLVVFYALGIPLTSYLELAHHSVSRRFGLPPWLPWATAAVQVVCTIGLARRRTASGAALGLSVTTIGAIGAHLRIGSPRTALPALVCTALQLWIARVRWPERWHGDSVSAASQEPR